MLALGYATAPFSGTQAAVCRTVEGINQGRFIIADGSPAPIGCEEG
jgi:hypothetical protein